MKFHLLPAILLASLSVPLLLHAEDTPAKKTPLRTFDTPHYILKTDLPDEMALEVDLRMTRMFEEYERRTAGFAAEPRTKFPFMLFQNLEDYKAAGGMRGSAGVFNPNTDTLMGWAGKSLTAETWHIVQHEGFHQFAFHTIHAQLPPWLNEGLAEYFGEALFIGDSFVSGFINPRRLKVVKEEITEKKWKSFTAMTVLSLPEWNQEMTGTNYDQGWAMVQFLAHGEDGKYQKAFTQYINLMNGGKSPTDAWNNVFGRDLAGFQAKCEKWWSELPEYPTNALYEKATVLRMTSILARCIATGQTFDNFADLLHSGKPTDLKLSRDLWLPTDFVEEATTIAPRIGKWTLENRKGLPPRLICITRDGTTYTGSFLLTGKKISQVNAAITPPAAAPATKPTPKLATH